MKKPEELELPRGTGIGFAERKVIKYAPLILVPLAVAGLLLQTRNKEPKNHPPIEQKADPKAPKKSPTPPDNDQIREYRGE